MARIKTSITVGRFAFFVLMIMQCCFLASYPAYYEDENGWYAVIILFIPAAVMWWWINSINADLCRVGLFWMVYVWLGVVPMIGIVFGRTGDKIESKGFWNASTLKMTLCITPFLLMLICYTGIASSNRDLHVRQVSEWSVKAVINLFDGIELLGVILDENKCGHGIPRDFKNAIIAFTCISFLWWPVGMPLDLKAAKRDYQDPREPCDERLHLVSCAIQVNFDAIFLGLRLGLCLGYGKNLSIFINKNIIIIIIHTGRMFNFCCCSEDTSTANQQQDKSSEPLVSTSRSVNGRGVNSSSVAPLPTPTAPPLPFNPAHTSTEPATSNPIEVPS